MDIQLPPSIVSFLVLWSVFFLSGNAACYEKLVLLDSTKLV